MRSKVVIFAALASFLVILVVSAQNFEPQATCGNDVVEGGELCEYDFDTLQGDPCNDGNPDTLNEECGFNCMTCGVPCDAGPDEDCFEHVVSQKCNPLPDEPEVCPGSLDPSVCASPSPSPSPSPVAIPQIELQSHGICEATASLTQEGPVSCTCEVPPPPDRVMGGGGNPAPKCRDGAKMDLITFLKENPGPIGHIGEDWYYYDFSGKPQKLLMQKSIELTMCCADCCNGFCNAIDPRFLCLPPVIYDDQDTIGVYDDQDTPVILQAPNVCRPVDPKVDQTFCKDLTGLPCLKGLMFAPITSVDVQVPAGTEELGGCCMAKFESELPTIGSAQNWFKCCSKGIDSDVQKHLETAWDCCEQFKQYGVFSSDKCYDAVFDDGNNDGLDDDLCEPLQASTGVAAGQDQGAQTSSQPTGAFDRFTNSLGAFVNGTVLVFVLMIGMTILLMRRKPSDRNDEALKELSEKLQSLHHDISTKVDKYDQVIPEKPETITPGIKL